MLMPVSQSAEYFAKKPENGASTAGMLRSFLSVVRPALLFYGNAFGKGIFVNLHEERFIKGFLINFQQFLTLQKLSAGPEGLVPFGRDVGTGMVYDK